MLTKYSQQPTGGPILLFDSQPEEPKTLLELKAKKKTAPPAPAAPTARTTANGAATTTAGEGSDAAMTDSGVGSGARAAAGVLTAVDEDEEGAEEAPVPEAFEVEEDEEEDASMQE